MPIQPLNVVEKRIAALKKHLRSRRGRRDFKAHLQLVKLQAQHDRRSATVDTMDRILRNIYTLENCRPDRMYMVDTTFFRSLAKETSVKYLTEERFIVNSNDPTARKNYADNYDRIFGEKLEEAKPAPEQTECSGGYYDGVDDEGNPIGHTCRDGAGCGLIGCPDRPSWKEHRMSDAAENQED